MNKKTIARTFLFALAAMLSACTRTPSLRGTTPLMTRVDSTVTTVNSGTVHARQESVLGFGVAGRVTQISFDVGGHVQKGDVIAEIENQDLKRIYVDAIADLNRNRDLFDKGLISKVAFTDSQRAHEIAKTNYEKTRIIAPFAGTITELNLALGELSQPAGQTNKPPIRLVDDEARIIKAQIDEIDLPRVKVGQKANIKISAVRPEPYTAEVTRVISYVDNSREQDRSCPVELKIVDAGGEIPVGASAEVEIITDTKDSVLALPSQLVLKSAGTQYVYMYSGGKLRRAPVKVGVANFDRTEILEGVGPHDIVVYAGGDTDAADGKKVRVEVKPWL